MKAYVYFLILSVLSLSCKSQQSTVKESDQNTSISLDKDLPNQKQEQTVVEKESPTPAAHRISDYIHLLKGKRVGLVVNHTSTINDTHLVDTLLSLGIKVKKIFAPEHGFRGKADAGQTVTSGKDQRTGLPIISLYGANKKPSPNQLQGLDIVVFDIQDVGVRFYTYISTMHYVMEACAEAHTPFVVLDRPNPNGNYVDGCVREPSLKSFVGMHPIPIVHGLTVGELAKMINGEGWLKGKIHCPLQVVKASHYRHSDEYTLPIKPSPNLPNQTSVVLYPSLCLFEATKMSVGRGTDFPFQVVGYPDSRYGTFSFVPQPNEGASKPIYQGKKCYGTDYRGEKLERRFTLKYLIDQYKRSPQKQNFFKNNNLFEKLSGSTKLRRQLTNGWTEEKIRATWQPALQEYKIKRQKYLLYE